MRERKADFGSKRPLVVCLYGPPGSGKSTTIRALRGLRSHPDFASGAQHFLPYDLEQLSDRGKRLRVLAELLDPVKWRRGADASPFDTLVLGMADISPSDVLRVAALDSVSLLHIALLPDVASLARQGTTRNSVQPWKQGQQPLNTLAGFIAHVDEFDLVATEGVLSLLRTLFAHRPSCVGLAALITDDFISSVTESENRVNVN